LHKPSSGNVRNLYLIGHRITKSLSPAIQNAAISKSKFNAKYSLLDVEQNQFDSAVSKILSEKETLGFNITVPYKERILSYVTELDQVASEVGAINTVKIRGEEIRGYNTDVAGVQISLRRLGLRGHGEGKEALVLGAGGAARACVFALLQGRFNKITIMNRTEDRASGLAKDFKDKFRKTEIIFSRLEPSEFATQVSRSDYLINAISESTSNFFPIPVDFSKAKKSLKIFDLNYKEDSLLLKKAESRGLKGIGGLPMLVEQGAKSFEIWTRLKAPRRSMTIAAIRALSVD
jgi:shikimate dehydrogenase